MPYVNTSEADDGRVVYERIIRNFAIEIWTLLMIERGKKGDWPVTLSNTLVSDRPVPTSKHQVS